LNWLHIPELALLSLCASVVLARDKEYVIRILISDWPVTLLT
jgi:hypothetical protein